MRAVGHPEVSVVLPTRDRAATLGSAMRSVLEQDFEDLELIVIDDASSDITPEVVASFSDERVRYVRQDRSLGAPAARNRGIAQSTGPLLAFQDSDDTWCEGSLGALVQALRSAPGNVGVAYGRVMKPDSEGGLLVPGGADLIRDGDLSSVLLRYNIVNLPSALVRASAVRDAGGFDERLRRYQDWDLFLRLSDRWRFVFVDRTVTKGGDAANRISEDSDARREALKLLLLKHRSAFRPRPDLEVAHLLALTRLEAGSRHWVGAATALARATRHPLSLAAQVGQRVAGVASPLDRAVGRV